VVLRGQADLIAATIIVSVALALALALTGFFTPSMARYSTEQQLAATLAKVSSSLTVTPAAVVVETFNVKAALYINPDGLGSVRLYVTAVAKQGNTITGCGSITVYNMTGSYAPLDSVINWQQLPSFTVKPDHIYIISGNMLTSLASLKSWNQLQQVTMYDLGVLQPNRYQIVKLELENCPSGSSIYAQLYIMINNKFHEVAEIPLTTIP
jgi:hypothetical protein